MQEKTSLKCFLFPYAKHEWVENKILTSEEINIFKGNQNIDLPESYYAYDELYKKLFFIKKNKENQNYVIDMVYDDFCFDNKKNKINSENGIASLEVDVLDFKENNDNYLKEYFKDKEEYSLCYVRKGDEILLFIKNGNEFNSINIKEVEKDIKKITNDKNTINHVFRGAGQIKIKDLNNIVYEKEISLKDKLMIDSNHLFCIIRVPHGDLSFNKEENELAFYCNALLRMQNIMLYNIDDNDKEINLQRGICFFKYNNNIYMYKTDTKQLQYISNPLDIKESKNKIIFLDRKKVKNIHNDIKENPIQFEKYITENKFNEIKNKIKKNNELKNEYVCDHFFDLMIKNPKKYNDGLSNLLKMKDIPYDFKKLLVDLRRFTHKIRVLKDIDNILNLFDEKNIDESIKKLNMSLQDFAAIIEFSKTYSFFHKYDNHFTKTELYLKYKKLSEKAYKIVRSLDKDIKENFKYSPGMVAFEKTKRSNVFGFLTKSGLRTNGYLTRKILSKISHVGVAYHENDNIHLSHLINYGVLKGFSIVAIGGINDKIDKDKIGFYYDNKSQVLHYKFYIHEKIVIGCIENNIQYKSDVEKMFFEDILNGNKLKSNEELNKNLPSIIQFLDNIGYNSLEYKNIPASYILRTNFYRINFDKIINNIILEEVKKDKNEILEIIKEEYKIIELESSNPERFYDEKNVPLITADVNTGKKFRDVAFRRFNGGNKLPEGNRNDDNIIHDQFYPKYQKQTIPESKKIIIDKVDSIEEFKKIKQNDKTLYLVGQATGEKCIYFKNGNINIILKECENNKF